MTDAIDRAPTNNTTTTTTEEGASANANASHGHGHFGPLALVQTTQSQLPPLASELQPGLHRVGPIEKETLGNPAPLGLAGFALTTFVLGCINMGARDVTQPNMVVGVAYAYGGLVQLCAGMWEMAAGNTFGATALSSYGGFWIALGITFTPGGFAVMSTLEKGWFIFTFLLVLCTLKSTFVFCGIFVTVDIAFLLLGIGYIHRNGSSEPNMPVIKAGGLFALLAAFQSWYVCLAGLMNRSNSFFTVPVFRMPWARGKKD